MAPADRARRGVEGVENPRPLARRPLEDARRGDRALAHAEIEHRDEHRVGRERHGAQHAAEQSGAHEGLRARQRPEVVQVPPHRLLPDPFVGLAVPGDHPAGLAGAEDHRPTIRPDGREDRGDVEVVVADVVRRAPGRTRRPCRWRRPGRPARRCRACCRRTRRRSGTAACRPTGPGSRCRRRRGPARRPTSGSTPHPRRRPRAARASRPSRTSRSGAPCGRRARRRLHARRAGSRRSRSTRDRDRRRGRCRRTARSCSRDVVSRGPCPSGRPERTPSCRSRRAPARRRRPRRSARRSARSCPATTARGPCGGRARRRPTSRSGGRPCRRRRRGWP